MRVAIRADASAALGLGHVQRCLALAHALRATGAEATFLTRAIDVDSAAVIERAGYPGKVVGGGPVGRGDACEAIDAADCMRALNVPGTPSAPLDLLIVDHYRLGASWHGAMRAAGAARLVAIDDLGDRALSVDLLVDHNLGDHAAKYAGRMDARGTLLAGPRHALLGPTYASAARHRPQATVQSIGIFMGGTDAANASALALAACVGAGYAGPVEIATTSANPNLEALRRAAHGRPGTTLALDLPDLAAFFERHGLQLGAGGGAMWERCCIGAPTLALVVAPNQEPVLRPLQALGAVAMLGAAAPHARLPDGRLADTHLPDARLPDVHALAAHLRELLGDAPRRAGLAARSRALVDGRGAARVAERLVALAA